MKLTEIPDDCFLKIEEIEVLSRLMEVEFTRDNLSQERLRVRIKFSATDNNIISRESKGRRVVEIQIGKRGGWAVYKANLYSYTYCENLYIDLHFDDINPTPEFHAFDCMVSDVIAKALNKCSYSKHVLNGAKCPSNMPCDVCRPMQAAMKRKRDKLSKIWEDMIKVILPFKEKKNSKIIFSRNDSASVECELLDFSLINSARFDSHVGYTPSGRFAEATVKGGDIINYLRKSLVPFTEMRIKIIHPNGDVIYLTGAPNVLSYGSEAVELNIATVEVHDVVGRSAAYAPCPTCHEAHFELATTKEGKAYHYGCSGKPEEKEDDSLVEAVLEGEREIMTRVYLAWKEIKDMSLEGMTFNQKYQVNKVKLILESLTHDFGLVT